MARNGSGNYSPPTNSWSPAVNSVAATAVDWNSILNDLSAALTQSVSRDGQASMTGNLPMGGNKLTGLAAGTGTGDSLRFEQLFDQGIEQDVASAATTDIGVINSNFIRITGTTTITSFGTNYKGPRFVRFAGALILTHNATTLAIPGGSNITTAAGDRAVIVPIGNPSSGWQIVAYVRADGSANATSINGGQIAGLRNKIINGKMEIAQRGTSFAAIANAAYSLDRWQFVNSSAAVITASQQSDFPSSAEFQSSLRLAVTTADTSIAAGDTTLIQQKIEGFNARDLIGRTFTLSFEVRSSKTGVHCVYFTNSGLNRSFIAEYTVNVANTWEKKTVTVPGGLISAGTWDWINGVGLSVGWALAVGSTFQTTAGAWQTGNFYATANQVNCLDTVGNIFAITGVQLEAGAVATPFEHRPYGQELALCQRYFEEVGTHIRGTVANAGGFLGTYVSYKVTKRAAPTLALGGAISTLNVSSEAQDEIVVDGFRYSIAATSANTDTSVIGRRFLVIAEL